MPGAHAEHDEADATAIEVIYDTQKVRGRPPRIDGDARVFVTRSQFRRKRRPASSPASAPAEMASVAFAIRPPKVAPISNHEFVVHPKVRQETGGLIERDWPVGPRLLRHGHRSSTPKTSRSAAGFCGMTRMSPDKRQEISMKWLGDLDSNQGCPGQSREFYR
jgi:hypothetical protein